MHVLYLLIFSNLWPSLFVLLPRAKSNDGPAKSSHSLLWRILPMLDDVPSIHPPSSIYVQSINTWQFNGRDANPLSSMIIWSSSWNPMKQFDENSSSELPSVAFQSQKCLPKSPVSNKVSKSYTETSQSAWIDLYTKVSFFASLSPQWYPNVHLKYGLSLHQDNATQ